MRKNIHIVKEYEDEGYISYMVHHNNISVYFNTHHHKTPYINILVSIKLKYKRLNIYYNFEDGMLQLDRRSTLRYNNDENFFNKSLNLSNLFLNNIKVIDFLRKMHLTYLGL